MIANYPVRPLFGEAPAPTGRNHIGPFFIDPPASPIDTPNGLRLFVPEAFPWLLSREMHAPGIQPGTVIVTRKGKEIGPAAGLPEVDLHRLSLSRTALSDGLLLLVPERAGEVRDGALGILKELDGGFAHARQEMSLRAGHE